MKDPIRLKNRNHFIPLSVVVLNIMDIATNIDAIIPTISFLKTRFNSLIPQ